MLRKVRVDGPAERLADLLSAARRAELDIDDWAVDTTTEYGWPGRGDGHAYVLVVAEDEVFGSDAVVRAVRAGYEAMAGRSSDWIVPGGSFVFLPDGLEPGWYDEVVPLAEALHAAEDAGDRGRSADLRRVLTRRIDELLPLAERRFDAFAAFTAGSGADDETTP